MLIVLFALWSAIYMLVQIPVTVASFTSYDQTIDHNRIFFSRPPPTKII